MNELTGHAWLLPSVSLWRREVVRFLRQRGRVVGALGTPVVFWLLIGSGLRNSFRLPNMDQSINYLEYSFPGMLALIVLFTAIFATISIIEDRREGFMQAVLAAPVSRTAIVLGKVFGSTTLAVGQALVFLLLIPLTGIHVTLAGIILAVAALTVMAIGLSAVGVLIAWPMDSIQGFHAIMNLVLMPMWLLSGAFFPASGASSWMGWIMAINPLTYGVATLRHALYMGQELPGSQYPAPMMSWLVSCAFSVTAIAVAQRMISRKA